MRHGISMSSGDISTRHDYKFTVMKNFVVYIGTFKLVRLFCIMQV